MKCIENKQRAKKHRGVYVPDTYEEGVMSIHV
jgi:hypothetical protein